MLDIDTAIKHCLEVAEENEELSSKFDEWDEWEKADADNCRECAADHRQLAEWLREFKEAKRLLKAAVEDITFILSYACSDEEMCCEECPTVNHACNKWRYTDEALKLIGGSENGET